LGESTPEEIAVRAKRTLEIMHDWGYAPTLQALADDLLGGAVPVPTLLLSANNSDDVVMEDGFAFLRTHRNLLEKSRRRVETHRSLNGSARTIAETFARELSAVCPLVECVGLSGSVASGGFESRDDIDVNLFVLDGTKYFVYAIALLLGLQAAIRHRKSRGLRKLICINVLWTRGQCDPFLRQDSSLAFELLHCRPILGGARFQGVIRANPWIDGFFPQLREAPVLDLPQPAPNSIGRMVLWIGRHERLLRSLEQSARLLTKAAYSLSHWLRRRDPTAMARLRFLQRVKYPYEVFQD